MRLSNCNSPYSCSAWRWNSTVPYLFGGLLFIFQLIFVALMSRNSPSMSRGENNGTVIPTNVHNQIDIMVAMKPKIVVIMAGDDKPSYLATPSLA
ncbi:unnamed protein product [Withania somnifera]